MTAPDWLRRERVSADLMLSRDQAYASVVRGSKDFLPSMVRKS